MADVSQLVSQVPASAWRIAADALHLPELPAAADEHEVWAFVTAHATPNIRDFAEFMGDFSESASVDLLTDALHTYGVEAVKSWRKHSESDCVAYAYVAFCAEQEHAPSNAPVRKALVMARFRTADISRRVSFEFGGAKALLPDRLDKLQKLLKQLCVDEDYGSHVSVESLDGMLYVGRGGRLKSTVVLEEGRRRSLPHRPAATDALHYDSNTGVLRITARTRRLAKNYASVMGETYFDNKRHFVERNPYTLEVLHGGLEALRPRRHPRIARVDLLTFDGVLGTASVSGKSADLEHLVKALPEVEFTEARLRVHLYDGDQFIADVRTGKSLTVPQRFLHDTNEYLVEVGIRGTPPRTEDVFELLSERPASIARWRDLLGDQVDEFVSRGVLTTARLEVVPSVDTGEELVVHVQDDGSLFGSGRRAEDGGRVLSVSDVDGLVVSRQALASYIAESLKFSGKPRPLDDTNVWMLGRKVLADELEVVAIFVVGAATRPIHEIIAPHVGAARVVVLVPEGARLLGEPAVDITWHSAETNLHRIIDFLGVRGRLPLATQHATGLVVQPSSGIIAFRGTTVDLSAGTGPCDFFLALAKAYPASVTTKQLDEIISPNRGDGRATVDAKKRLRKQLQVANIAIDDLVTSTRGACKLKVPPLFS